MWRQALRPIVPQLNPLSTAAVAATANLMSHLSPQQFTSSTSIAFELLPEDEFQALDEAVQQAEASIPGPKKTKTMHSPHPTPLRPSSSQLLGAEPSKPHPAGPLTGLLTARSLHPVSLLTLPSADNNSAGAAGNSSKEDSPHPISLSSLPSAHNSAGVACDLSGEDSPRSPLSNTRRNIFLGSPGPRRPSKARHIIDKHFAYVSSPGLNDGQSALASLSGVDEDARLAFSSITADRKTPPGTPSSSSRADTDIEDLVQVREHVNAHVSNLPNRDDAAMDEVASMSVDATLRIRDSKSGPASWRLEGCSQTSIRAAGPRGMVAGAVASHIRGQQRFGFSSGPRLGGGSAHSSGDDDTQVLSVGEDGRQRETPLQAHRRRRGLSVTDVSSSEWCELQVDFGLREGRPEPTESMKAGTARHAELEVESLKELELVEVQVQTREDYWAVRLLNMLAQLQQLKLIGMTRELYVVGELEGVWMVGMIDELQLEGEGGTRLRGEAARPLILDTKTRQRATPPSEAQKLTSRLQLMCYKMLFDGLASGGVTFPYVSFHEHFGLDHTAKLSDDISVLAFEVGVTEGILQKPSFGDIVRALLSEWRTVQPSQPRLLIRYEWQQDHRLLGQDDFLFDPEWAHARVARHLEYWKGLREPDPVPPEELWKCRFCAFSDSCPTAQSKNSHS